METYFGKENSRICDLYTLWHIGRFSKKKKKKEEGEEEEEEERKKS